MSSPYYQPSGRLPANAVMLALLSLPVVAVPAWLYGWLMIHSPFILLNLFGLAAFAVVMGRAASNVAHYGKARRRKSRACGRSSPTCAWRACIPTR